MRLIGAGLWFGALIAGAASADCTVGGGRASTAASPAIMVRGTELRVGGLRLIGQKVLPRRMEYAATVVGGLSGIDYDAASGDYVLITDDRTLQDSPNPPRFYRARLDFDLSGFQDIRLTRVAFLRQPGGAVYPKAPRPGAPDPEAIRVDPCTGHLVWASEGERQPGARPPRVTDPFVREVSTAGESLREYRLPDAFRMFEPGAGGAATAGRQAPGGPRNNTAFEGLAFTPDGRHLAALMEGPLLEDGEPPSPARGAWSRLVIFDRERGSAIAQYAYPVEPVRFEPVPPDAFRVNGPTEILALSSSRFLVLERSFSVGVTGNQVRLYEIELPDPSSAPHPQDRRAGLPVVGKRLVYDFDSLVPQWGPVANLEGMTFGPRLANGHPSLVLVADDNFPQTDSDTDRNQFLVFEVLPSF